MPCCCVTLLCCAAFSELRVSVADFNRLYPKDYIVALFRKINVILPERVSSLLYTLASGGRDMCTLHEFRCALNDYLFAEKQGNAQMWLNKNGDK